LIESSINESTHSLAIEGDWMTVVTTEGENKSRASPGKSHFFEHLLNPSFRQSLINDFVEMEGIISQQLTSSKDENLSLPSEHRKIIRDILALLSQSKFLKTIEILTNPEYQEQ
jgi:hypothetical protein